MSGFRQTLKVPDIDSSANIRIGDVVGNKSDTISGNSVMALTKQVVSAVGGGGSGGHTPLYTGNVYYVDNGQADDTKDGTSPETAKKTIGAGFGLMATGDKLIVKAGTYSETGLDLGTGGTKHALEMECELGTVLDPATGTGFTVSGNYCMVSCAGASLKVTPATNQTGVVISGVFCYIHDIRVPCFITNEATSADIGFDITGTGCVLNNCRCSSPDVAAFKIQGDKIKLENCCTGGGNAGVAFSSIGFWFTNTCDKARVYSCGSQGHGTSGFQVDTGCTNGVIEGCYSGGGDGRWGDVDNAFVWSNFHYDDEIYKEIEVDSAQTINIFKLTGTVKIMELEGEVTEIITSVGNPTMHISVYSVSGEVDITKDAGPDINTDVIGTVYIRNADSSNAIVKGDNDNTPFKIENGSYRDPEVSIIVGADDDSTTYVRYNANAACTDGKILWSCKWRPITKNGFLQPA